MGGIFILKTDNYTAYQEAARKRLSEIGGQEIINLFDGVKLGVVADIDLIVDDKTGRIEFLLIPDQRRVFGFSSERNFIEVPWSAVKKIGQDALIVDMQNTSKRKLG